MMNLIIKLLLFFVLSSFMGGLPKDDKMAYQLMARFAKGERKLGLEPIGYGLRGGKNEIKCLSITFTIDQVLTIESARKIGLCAVERFLKFLNAQEKLKQYLVQSPLTAQNVCIKILGKEAEGADYIRNVAVGEGNVLYFSFEFLPNGTRCLHKETFEEAQALLNPG